MTDGADRFARVEKLAYALHDDDVAKAIDKFISIRWRKACFRYPEAEPLLWIKFANQRRSQKPELHIQCDRSFLREYYRKAAVVADNHV